MPQTVQVALGQFNASVRKVDLEMREGSTLSSTGYNPLNETYMIQLSTLIPGTNVRLATKRAHRDRMLV